MTRAFSSVTIPPPIMPGRIPWFRRLPIFRIHGGYGYSTEFDIERYFRDAPLMIVGEGTNEIQRNVIVRQLIRRNSVTP